jgi:hypothetical protein
VSGRQFDEHLIRTAGPSLFWICRRGLDVRFGSAFAVREDGLLATCFHVMKDGFSAWAQNPNGELVGLGFVRGRRDWDTAILKAKSGKVSPLPLCTELQDEGSPVWMVRHPWQNPDQVVRGEVVRYHSLQADPAVPVLLIMRLASEDGDSGSPILNARGEVIGMLAGTGRGPGCSFGILTSCLSHLIEGGHGKGNESQDSPWLRLPGRRRPVDGEKYPNPKPRSVSTAERARALRAYGARLG